MEDDLLVATSLRNLWVTLLPQPSWLVEAIIRRVGCSWLLLSPRHRRREHHLAKVSPVRETPSRCSDKQQCYYDIDEIQAQIAHLGREDRAEGGIFRGVQQHRQQQATVCVMEDPGEDDRQGHCADD